MNDSELLASPRILLNDRLRNIWFDQPLDQVAASLFNAGEQSADVTEADIRQCLLDEAAHAFSLDDASIVTRTHVHALRAAGRITSEQSTTWLNTERNDDIEVTSDWETLSSPIRWREVGSTKWLPTQYRAEDVGGQAHRGLALVTQWLAQQDD